MLSFLGLSSTFFLSSVFAFVGYKEVGAIWETSVMLPALDILPIARMVVLEFNKESGKIRFFGSSS